MAGALIVLASIGAADFRWLDRLRREHYPVERNHVPAHLTLFHALPPSAEAEARRLLRRLSSRAAPNAEVSGVMDLGGGVAFRVHSEELEAIREELADHFHGMLSAQDRGGWRAHITIQNKVSAREARALLQALGQSFEPRALLISGVELVRYSDHEWRPLQQWSFRGIS